MITVGDAEPYHPKKGMLIKAEAKKWGQLNKWIDLAGADYLTDVIAEGYNVQSVSCQRVYPCVSEAHCGYTS